MEDVQDNVYSVPKADLIDSESPEAKTLFLPLSMTKLWLMNVLTMGIYSLYWFYKNWKLQERTMDKNIYPVMRALFAIFFIHALFKRIEVTCESKGIDKNWNVNLLVTSYILFTAASYGVGFFADQLVLGGLMLVFNLLMTLALTWPLHEVQKSINQINDDPKGALNSSITVVNILVLILGLLFWAGNIFLFLGLN